MKRKHESDEEFIERARRERILSEDSLRDLRMRIASAHLTLRLYGGPRQPAMAQA